MMGNMLAASHRRTRVCPVAVPNRLDGNDGVASPCSVVRASPPSAAALLKGVTAAGLVVPGQNPVNPLATRQLRCTFDDAKVAAGNRVRSQPTVISP